MPFAPRVRAARNRSGWTVRTPDWVAMATESALPITTTKRIAVSESPNQRIATGSQQMDGSACRPRSGAPNSSSAIRLRPTARPSGTPMAREIPYPTARRASDWPMVGKRSPWRASSHRDAAPGGGGGKIQAGQGPRRATASQIPRTARPHPSRRSPRPGAASSAEAASTRISAAAVIVELLPQGPVGLGGKHLLDASGEPRDGGVLDLARPRDVDGKDAEDPPGPRLHQRDAGPEDGRFADVVGDEDDGLSRVLPDARELAEEDVAGLRVEGAERLVHEEDFGVASERAGERDPLAHAPGQLVHPGMGKVREAHEAEQLLDALGDAVLRPPRLLERIGDVPCHVPPGEEGVVLEEDRPIRTRPPDRLAAEEQLALIGLVETGEEVQERRLPAAARTTQAKKLAGFDVERDPGESEEAARERSGHPAQREEASGVGKLHGNRLAHRVPPIAAWAREKRGSKIPSTSAVWRNPSRCASAAALRNSASRGSVEKASPSNARLRTDSASGFPSSRARRRATVPRSAESARARTASPLASTIRCTRSQRFAIAAVVATRTAVGNIRAGHRVRSSTSTTPPCSRTRRLAHGSGTHAPAISPRPKRRTDSGLATGRTSAAIPFCASQVRRATSWVLPSAGVAILRCERSAAERTSGRTTSWAPFATEKATMRSALPCDRWKPLMAGFGPTQPTSRSPENSASTTEGPALKARACSSTEGPSAAPKAPDSSPHSAGAWVTFGMYPTRKIRLPSEACGSVDRHAGMRLVAASTARIARRRSIRSPGKTGGTAGAGTRGHRSERCVASLERCRSRRKDAHGTAATAAGDHGCRHRMDAVTCQTETLEFITVGEKTHSGWRPCAFDSVHSLLKSARGFWSRSMTQKASTSCSKAAGSNPLPRIQRATVYGSRSRMISAPYSWRSRYCSTSSCRAPTAPRMGSRKPPSGRANTWIAPSCESCWRPFSSCLRLRASLLRSRAKISGEKRGSSANSMTGCSQSVSPMRRAPVSKRPMTSPGYASSMTCRSLPKSWCGMERRMSFSSRTFRTVMPRSKRPEHTRRNASRSRWAGSMFAWILKTNPLKAGESGSTASPVVVCRAPGGGASPTKAARNSSTPISFQAEPKKAGDSSPRRMRARSNGSPAWARSSTSSASFAVSFCGSERPFPDGCGSDARTSGTALRFASAPRSSNSVATPAKSWPCPNGQVTATVRIPSTSSTSWSRSKGSRPGRSSLL